MSEEDSEWLDRPDHPLMNNVILTQVFEHLRSKELKECRFVCKTWNILTIPFTHKTFKVTIFGNQDYRKEKEHRIDNFVEIFRSNKLGIPFARFKVGSFCTTEGSIGQKFLQICEDTTKEIEFLVQDNFRVEDVSEILKSTPKLETFHIPSRLQSTTGNIVKLFPQDSKPRLTALKNFYVRYDNPKERNAFCPTFLEEIITAAEDISSLHLWDSCLAPGEEFIFSSFEVLSVIEKLGRESSIQEIVISPTKTDCADILRKMASKRNGLKLKKLKYYEDDTQTIFQTISFLKDTLEFLQMGGGKSFTSFIEFSEMTRLTLLIVTFSKDLNTRFVNLSKIFPVLESLYLFCKDEVKYEEFFPETDPCPKLKTLSLLGFSMKLNGFNQMLIVFPNLTYLKLSIKEDGEQILRQIWTQMTQLESLHISGCIEGNETVLDCLLTGISSQSQVLHKIRDVVKNIKKMRTEVKRREAILNLRNEHAQFPSIGIGNLTNLRSLSLCLTGDEEKRSEGKYLTDLTGYLGFYCIKSLKELFVARCKLTKNCCEMLGKDMGLQTWRFYTTENVVISASV